MLGGGLMGSGIATASLMAGMSVVIKEVNQKFLDVSVEHLRLQKPLAWTWMDCKPLSARGGQAVVATSSVVQACIAAPQIAASIASTSCHSSVAPHAICILT